MKTSKKVAVLVARQGSSRLPGKALALMCGKPVVWHIIQRLKHMSIFDDICLATSDLPIDRPLLDLARKEDIKFYAGSPEDVLDRMYHAASLCNAGVVIEIGGDCPLVDKDVVAKAVEILETQNADYVTNVSPTTFPDGIDIHAVRMDALKFAARNAVLSSQRLHPFSYFHRHHNRFRSVNFTHSEDLSHYRWTLDYEEDFVMISKIFEKLGPNGEPFKMAEILNFLQQNPQVAEINKKWNPPRSQDAAPAYWFNKTYMKDLLRDVVTLGDLCSKLEDQKDYEKLKLHYFELEEMAHELKQRAEHLAKNSSGSTHANS